MDENDFIQALAASGDDDIPPADQLILLLS